MGTTKFSDLKRYHKLSEYDINRTNINSREDKYQDAVLKRLESKTKPKKEKKKPKQTTLTYNQIILFFDEYGLPLTKKQIHLLNCKSREEL